MNTSRTEASAKPAKPAPARGARRATERRRASAGQRASSDRPPGKPMAAAPHVAKAMGYARAVVAGEIVAGKWTKKACARHLADLEKEGTDDFQFRFNDAAAERFCRFAEKLPHIKGPKASRRELFVLEPWQCFFFCALFGWLHAETGLRRFRRFYLEVARGNGKSYMLAAVGLYMLCADGESGAEIYSAATTRQQAKIVFGTAQDIVKRSPKLQQALGVKCHAHHISQESTASVFRALASEEDRLDGLNNHFVAIDELHAHKTRGLYDVLETGMGKRDQPLLGVITTAGSDRQGICYETRGDLIKILNGTAADESFFGIIYAIDASEKAQQRPGEEGKDEQQEIGDQKKKGDDWRDESTWVKANPNLGVSVNTGALRATAEKAKRTPAARAAFRTKHLDVWVAANSALFDIDRWNELADEALELEDFAGQECIFAFDLASKNDIAARVQVFRETLPAKELIQERALDRLGALGQMATGVEPGPEPAEARDQHIYTVFARHYTNEGYLADAKISELAAWHELGLFEVSGGNSTSQAEIEDDLLEDVRRFQAREIGFDPFQATGLMQRLTELGLPAVEIPMTVKQLSEATKLLGEELIPEGQIRHNGDPVLAWMISNVVGHYDKKENVWPQKERRENKVDGAIALIMALSRWMVLADTEQTTSDSPFLVIR